MDGYNEKHSRSFFGINSIIFSLVLLAIIPVILLAPMIKTHTISYGADTWFHLMRIYEMRCSLKDGSVLGTIGNIFTFGQAGQGINGMYPAATLRFLVLITNWLSPVNQVYSVMILILWISSACNLYVFRKIGITKFKAVLATITMTYILNLYVIIKSGSLGLAISISLIPLVFGGLVLIQSEKEKERKKATYLIGFGIGLIFLSHIMSAMFGIIIVGMAAGLDVIYKKHNFLNYVFSGLISFLIGIPTIITTLLIGKEAMPVASFGRKAGSLLNVLSPLWDPRKGTAYLGWTNLTVLAIVYIFVSLLINKKYLSLKVIALTNIVLGTNVGYLKLMDFIQFPERFWIFGALLCLFILILECFDNPKFGEAVSIVFTVLVLITAINVALNYHHRLVKQDLWQSTSKVYDRNNTKIDNNSYSYVKFKKLRTYVDYLPIQQKKTALLPPKASAPSKEMLDVNFAKNVRYTGFDSNTIKINKKKNVVSQNKAIIKNVKNNSIFMKIKVSKRAKYDLPFWIYNNNNYIVRDNKKLISYENSSQGRLSIVLKKGSNLIEIKQKLPKIILFSYFISILTLLVILIKILKAKFLNIFNFKKK